MTLRPSALLIAATFLTPAPALAQQAPATTDERIDALMSEIEALKAEVKALKEAGAKPVPSWKGAPELADKDKGFSFKPKGLLQFDAGYVGFPDGRELNGTVGGLNYNNLGWNTRARRIVLGAEGGLPGGFKYKVELNLAQGSVDYEDITLSYDFKNLPLTITAGNFYPYSSLDTMTSSRLTSMLERASFTDAFNYNRRLGVGLSLADRKNDRYTLSAGLFSEPINNGNSDRTGWEAAVRGTYSPPVGDGLIHLGASFHHRVNPRDEQGATYRTRPLTQLTSESFVNTGGIAADGDDSVGVELGGVFGSLHFAAEAQKLWVRGYDPSDLLTHPNNATTGIRYNGDPSFEGGYVELGYFFTGEKRGYKNGRWDRSTVLKPFDKGGWGALRLTGRVDYVNLNDRVDDSFSDVAAPFYVNGGKQLGYQLSLIWDPMDYIRLMAQYGHLDITGGPRAATVDPSSSDPINKRKFGVDTAAVRAQVEF